MSTLLIDVNYQATECIVLVPVSSTFDLKECFIWLITL